jgi:hypothetical protein
MAGNKIGRLQTIWRYWNIRKLESNDALIAMGKILDEPPVHRAKAIENNPVEEQEEVKE